MRGAILANVDVDHQNPIIIPYCDLKNMRLSLKTTTYIMFQYLGLGHFVMVTLEQILPYATHHFAT
jgi:hypothetical protein